MILKYSNTNIEKYFLDYNFMQRKIGFDLTKQIKKRIDQLESFANVFELMGSGIDNPHLLHGNLYGCIGWSITSNVRIILDLNLDKNQKYDIGMTTKKELIIKGVEDYHGGKENWIIS